MDLFDLPSLIAAAHGETRLKYLCFWSDRPKQPGGAPGPEIFSQWFAAPFEVEGARYPTAEHFMMAEKARLFGDRAALSKIRHAASPGAAKAYGREVLGFDLAVWERERESIVTRGSLAKFSQNPALRAYLLGTGARVLVEASPRDAVWGAGIAAHHPDIERPERWPGLNLLGFCLMRARAALRDG